MCFLMTGGVVERVDRCSDGRWREHGDRPPHRCHAKGSNFAFRDASEAETARVTAITRGQQAAAESPPWPDRVTRR